MKKKHYLVYKTTNLVNGKIYIGKHETDNLDDGYLGSGILIQRAIEKYGEQNFKREILFECSSQEEMNAKEAELVNEDFLNRNDVYNIKLGGQGGWDYLNTTGLNHSGNFKPLSETCKRIFEETGEYPSKGWAKRLKENNPEKYEEWRKKNSMANKQYAKSHPKTGELNPMYGKHHSNESRRKMSEKKQGRNNNQFGKMWICNDLTGENKVILKTNPIPNGWRKGRII